MFHRQASADPTRHANPIPELVQPLRALLGRIAGDQGGIDGADRDAGNPFGFEPRFRQALVHPGLIGAERAAALQHEHTALASALGTPGSRFMNGCRSHPPMVGRQGHEPMTEVVPADYIGRRAPRRR